MKTLKTAFFILVLTMSIFSLMTCTTQPATKKANSVTINISTVCDSSITDVDFVLSSNNAHHPFTRTNNTFYYSEVLYGKYTLNIYDQVIETDIVIEEENVVINILLDPEKNNYDLSSIENNTGYDISFLCINRTNELWTTMDSNLLRNVIPDGDTQSVILFPTSEMPNRRNIRIMDPNGNYYTKYHVPIIDNSSISFTKDDLDGDTINDVMDLSDTQKYSVMIYVMNHEEIIVSSIVEIRNLSLRIGDKTLEPYRESNNGGFLEQKFSLIHYKYDFLPGETYQIHFDATINSFVDNPNISKTFDLEILPELVIDFPETIGDKEIALNWKYIPNNEQNSDFQQISISSSTRGLNKSWVQDVNLLPSQRDFLIYEKIIPDADFSSTILSYSHTNHIISGRFIIYSYFNKSARYNNGVLID